ncbi:MAG: hypothetical protein B1H03_00595 [Planctomycetales bacterium 4484_113]|nr:MAG: hypothetical protein B1H03_00595 [Planctomycetales bacterium 4484_113]
MSLPSAAADTDAGGAHLRLLRDYKLDPQACAYCAKCHDGCPTYEATGDEAFSARGKILLWAALKGDFGEIPPSALEESLPSGALAKSRKLLQALDYCVRCYHCLEVCPAHMATVPIFETMRFELAREQPPPALHRFLMGSVMPNRSLSRAVASVGAIPFSVFPFLARRVRMSGKLTRWLLSLGERDARMNSLAAAFPTVFLGRREFSLPASPILRSQVLQAIVRAQPLAPPFGDASERNGELRPMGYFLDCLSDAFMPAVFYGTTRLLNRLGYRVVTHSANSCCGASALNTGDERAFVAMARSLAREFGDLRDERGRPVKTLLFTNPTCYKTVAERYAEILGAEELARLPQPVLDVAFLEKELAGLPDGAIQLSDELRSLKVAWHNPCNLDYALGVKGSRVLAMLKRLRLDITEYSEVEGCCGYGGMFYLRYPDDAAELSAKKLRLWRDEGIDLVLTNSAGCIGHLNATAIRERISIPTLHWVEAVGSSPAD